MKKLACFSLMILVVSALSLSGCGSAAATPAAGAAGTSFFPNINV